MQMTPRSTNIQNLIIIMWLWPFFLNVFLRFKKQKTKWKSPKKKKEKKKVLAHPTSKVKGL